MRRTDPHFYQTNKTSSNELMRTSHPTKLPAAFLKRIRKIRAFILDVDGVLTDGAITYVSDGTEIKTFSVLDGQGIKMAQELGIRFAIITGHASEMVQRRAKELSILDVYLNSIDKLAAYEDFKLKHNLPDDEIAFMGDDVLDIPVLKKVGLAFAPANAHKQVKLHAHFQCNLYGGHGAVREAIDLILDTNGVKY
jgi:3-deoxy-D-manno-octulosonate 8-phosphate phosphatase (KDO 8-P phosphatase)